ncbi:hypothetical protein [Burkholderia contaminans]|uniref:hypothetical protein n=1 Tax=Burkholderia contaminans TaxID=488447 RepID=UPI00269991F1
MHASVSRYYETLASIFFARPQLRDQMDGGIGCGCLPMKDCLLRNPGNALSKRGRGAVLLEGEPVRQRKST